MHSASIDHLSRPGAVQSSLKRQPVLQKWLGRALLLEFDASVPVIQRSILNKGLLHPWAQNFFRLKERLTFLKGIGSWNISPEKNRNLSKMPLRQWMLELPSGGVADSHVLLDGGKLKLQPTSEQAFLTRYAEAISNGDSLFVAERLTGVFRYAIDLDIAAPRELTSEEMLGVATIIHGTVCEFFPPSACLITTAEAVHVNAKTKSSAHLIFEDVCATVDTARMLREAVVMKLRLLKPLKEVDSSLDWGKIVDDGIYNCGLRMVFSKKMANCSVCKNRKADRESCLQCSGTGRVDQGRPHLPFAIIDSLAQVEMVGDNYSIPEWVERTHLRVFTAVSQQSMFRPAWFEQDSNPVRTKRSRRTGRISGGTEEGQEIFNVPKEELPAETVRVVEKCVKLAISKGAFPKEYKTASIVKAYKVNVGGLGNEVIWARSDSTYCINISSNHSSNTIYFSLERSVSGARIYSRCFCRCLTTTGRRFGMCKDFRSEGFNLPNSAANALFGRSCISTDASTDSLELLLEVPHPKRQQR